MRTVFSILAVVCFFLVAAVAGSLVIHTVLCGLNNGVCLRDHVFQLSGLGQLNSCSHLAGCVPEMNNIVLIFLFVYFKT